MTRLYDFGAQVARGAGAIGVGAKPVAVGIAVGAGIGGVAGGIMSSSAMQGLDLGKFFTRLLTPSAAQLEAMRRLHPARTTVVHELSSSEYELEPETDDVDLL